MSRIGYAIILISFLWPMSLVATAALWGVWVKFIFSAAISILSLIFSITIIAFISKKRGGNKFQISNAQLIDKDVMSFVIAFLPAFFVNEISDTRGVIVFVTFLVLFLMALFATRSYFTNLFILLCGWRIYSAEIQSGGREKVRAYLIVPSKNKLTDSVANLARIGSTNFYVVPKMS